MCKKIIFSVITMMTCFMSCSLEYRRVTDTEEKIPQIVFENLKMIQYSNNQKKLDLETLKLEQYKNSSIVFAENVKFNLYNLNNEITTFGNANLVSVDTEKENFQFFDKFEFLDKSQDIKISGSSLKWDSETEQIVSEKKSKITLSMEDLTITGKDFSASSISNTFLFSDSVYGQQILVNQTTNEKEKIVFSGDSMQGHVSNNDSNNSTILSGNANIKTSSMTIQADSIELYGKDFSKIKAKGNISGTNSEAELQFNADSLEYDQNTKVVILSGNVQLKDLKNDVIAKAQIIEYDQKSDVAVLQIDVELKQKSNICTGAYSIYRKKDQILELAGNASVKQDEDTFRAQSIKFNMQTEEIELDGNIRGTVTSSSEKKEKSDE